MIRVMRIIWGRIAVGIVALILIGAATGGGGPVKFGQANLVGCWGNTPVTAELAAGCYAGGVTSSAGQPSQGWMGGSGHANVSNPLMLTSVKVWVWLQYLGSDNQWHNGGGGAPGSNGITVASVYVKTGCGAGWNHWWRAVASGGVYSGSVCHYSAMNYSSWVWCH